MKIKYLGNAFLVSAIAFLFLIPSSNPANAQAAGWENGACVGGICDQGNTCGNEEIGCYCNSDNICAEKPSAGGQCGTIDNVTVTCQAGLLCERERCTAPAEAVGEGEPGDLCTHDSDCTGAGNCRSGGRNLCVCEGVMADRSGICVRAPEQPAAEEPGAAPPAVQQLDNPLGTGADIPEIIARVIKAVMGLVGAIGLLMFIYGGFTWMTAGGSEKRVTQGKQILTWAVLGLVVIFTSYAVLSFVIEKLTTPTNVQQNQPQP